MAQRREDKGKARAKRERGWDRARARAKRGQGEDRARARRGRGQSEGQGQDRVKGKNGEEFPGVSEARRGKGARVFKRARARGKARQGPRAAAALRPPSGLISPEKPSRESLGVIPSGEKPVGRFPQGGFKKFPLSRARRPQGRASFPARLPARRGSPARFIAAG
jgi:hypothetical protein